MKNLEINKENLEKFLLNLRNEDFEELKIFLKNNTIDNFINICLKNKSNTDFLADNNNKAVALGGIKPENKDTGQIWLLCSKDWFKHKIELYKIIKNRIELFKKDYLVLYNYIYKSNFKALIWLKKFGFKHKKVNSEFKIFYFKKEEQN